MRTRFDRSSRQQALTSGLPNATTILTLKDRSCHQACSLRADRPDDPAKAKPQQRFAQPAYMHVYRMAFFSVPELTTGEIVTSAWRPRQAGYQSHQPDLERCLADGRAHPSRVAAGGTRRRRHLAAQAGRQRFQPERLSRDNGAFERVSVAIGGVTDIDRELIRLLRAEDVHGFVRSAIANRVSILISSGTSSRRPPQRLPQVSRQPRTHRHAGRHAGAVSTPSKLGTSFGIEGRPGHRQRDNPKPARGVTSHASGCRQSKLDSIRLRED